MAVAEDADDAIGLGVGVDWDYCDEFYNVNTPLITLTSYRSRPIFVEKVWLYSNDICLLEIADFDHYEIRPWSSFTFRSGWSDGFESVIVKDFEDISIIVTDSEGNRWESDYPDEQPSWVTIEDGHKPVGEE